MTTLTFDLAELDQELGDLLAARWTVRLLGRDVPDPVRVVAPPPISVTLVWGPLVKSADHAEQRRLMLEVPGFEVTGLQVICDALVVKVFSLAPLRLSSIDSLSVTLNLTIDP